MINSHPSRSTFIAIILLSLAMVFCSRLPGEQEVGEPSNQPPYEPDEDQPYPESAIESSTLPAMVDKWSLWSNGTQLRGANIYQRIVFPEIDGTEFIGPGPIGPPYTQQDLDRLSALGANYVNISHVGLFTIEPPYKINPAAVENLDRLLEMVAEADMFTVITFRSGPGRSEFSLLRDGAGDWFPESHLIENVWEDEDAQQAWAAMWHFTAERYADNPIVVGYDLMCEPNANDILDNWDPEAFDAEYGGTGYDWNTWYPDLVAAIREVDAETPIIVGGNGYSLPEWLPFIQTMPDPHLIYAFHQYEPHPYTHQDPANMEDYQYPGSFDLNYDGTVEDFNDSWLEDLLTQADEFAKQEEMILAVNEFGLVRWAPGGAKYVANEMRLFELHGWNYAAWQWYPAWEPLLEGDNSFNFRLGPDSDNLSDVNNELLEAYKQAWSRNTLRPSNDSP